MKELMMIQKMWSEDCIIVSNLEDATRQTPMLHSKYLSLLSEAKITLKRVEFEQKRLLKDKWLYYTGKMTQEEMLAKGWQFDPFNGLRVMKTDMEYYYNSDIDIQASIEKINYWKTVIDTLQEIIENIKWRHQTIGNIIKWKVFESGG